MLIVGVEALLTPATGGKGEDHGRDLPYGSQRRLTLVEPNVEPTLSSPSMKLWTILFRNTFPTIKVEKIYLCVTRHYHQLGTRGIFVSGDPATVDILTTRQLPVLG